MSQKFFLIPSDNPLLRKGCLIVNNNEIPALKAQLYWLDKLRKKVKGAAIAAPQLGDLRRWFIWGTGLVINPEITFKGTDMTKTLERCLSFPGLEVPVERPNLVAVTYTDQDGKAVSQVLTGMTATVFQHELDHLNGICIDTYEKRKSTQD